MPVSPSSTMNLKWLTLFFAFLVCAEYFINCEALYIPPPPPRPGFPSVYHDASVYHDDKGSGHGSCWFCIIINKVNSNALNLDGALRTGLQAPAFEGTPRLIPRLFGKEKALAQHNSGHKLQVQRRVLASGCFSSQAYDVQLGGAILRARRVCSTPTTTTTQEGHQSGAEGPRRKQSSSFRPGNVSGNGGSASQHFLLSITSLFSAHAH